VELKAYDARDSAAVSLSLSRKTLDCHETPLRDVFRRRKSVMKSFQGKLTVAGKHVGLV
jgi:hypothetical protein